MKTVDGFEIYEGMPIYVMSQDEFGQYTINYNVVSKCLPPHKIEYVLQHFQTGARINCVYAQYDNAVDAQRETLNYIQYEEDWASGGDDR